MRFENRRWLVIPTSKIDDIDFTQIKESSKESLRKSTNGEKTFVKYEVVDVKEDFETKYIHADTNKEVSYTTSAGVYGRPSIYSSDYTEYNHADILALLSTEEWTTKPEE